jgi:imidazolonepropionase
MKEEVDLIIENANEIVTLRGPNRPRVKDEMKNIGVIKKSSIAIKKDKIIAIGRKLPYKADMIIDASGKTITPGFIDPHTHLVFAGSREFELEMKTQGLSYKEIAKRGGILYTVEQTRKASESRLTEESIKRLRTMITHGTTTCEAKSGYGLNTETERKILTIHKKLNKKQPVEIVSTLLGAHATPPGLTTEEYTRCIINEMIPALRGLAEFCDVFCERGFFSYKQSKMILITGKKHGLKPKIHADELTDTNSAGLAAEINAVTADHLLKSNNKNLKRMAEKKIIGVLLPGTVLSLMKKDYPDAKRMINLGVPVALGTDLNPNCYTENMQLIIQLACMNMKMTPAEALCASTFNAACAIKRNNIIGSIEPGKQADILILNCPNHTYIPYHFGVNLVETVIKKGRIIHTIK